MKEIVEKLIRKKELRDLDIDFVSKIVKKNFNGGERKKEFRQKFKEVRGLLRKAYGMFVGMKEKRGVEVYNKIFEKIGNVKSVLDVGCGLDVLDFPFARYGVGYYGCDVGQGYVDEVNKFLKENGLKGKGFVFDLVYGDYSKLPSADVCFCFKVLEGLELFEKGVSEKVLKGLRCKWVIVSFAKKSLSGKVIKKQGRVWFMKILNKLGWKYEIFNSMNEIFFVIRK